MTDDDDDDDDDDMMIMIHMIMIIDDVDMGTFYFLFSMPWGMNTLLETNISPHLRPFLKMNISFSQGGIRSFPGGYAYG